MNAKLDTPASPELPRKHRVIVVSEHALARAGMVHLINAEPDLYVAEEASSTVDLGQSTRARFADALVLDAPFDRIVQEISFANGIPVLLITNGIDEGRIGVDLHRGTSCCVCHRATPFVFIAALRRIVSGCIPRRDDVAGLSGDTPADQGKSSGRMFDPRVRSVLQIITSDCKISATRAARAVHLSTSRLNTLMNNTLGVGFRSASGGARIAKARDLLRTTPLSVKQVAAAVGYAHSASFIRAFERQVGRSPSAFRQLLAGET